MPLDPSCVHLYEPGDLKVIVELDQDFKEVQSVFLIGTREDVYIGGRNELLDMRDDIDKVLEEMP